MTGRLARGCICVLPVIALWPFSAPAQPREAREKPGYERGSTLLPNGWRIAPAGRHMNVGDLPLGMVESPDGRYLVVTDNGYVRPALVVVDLKNFLIKSRLS